MSKIFDGTFLRNRESIYTHGLGCRIKFDLIPSVGSDCLKLSKPKRPSNFSGDGVGTNRCNSACIRNSDTCAQCNNRYNNQHLKERYAVPEPTLVGKFFHDNFKCLSRLMLFEN